MRRPVPRTTTRAAPGAALPARPAARVRILAAVRRQAIRSPGDAALSPPCSEGIRP